jgi:type IV pilus assembly protein PilE
MENDYCAILRLRTLLDQEESGVTMNMKFKNQGARKKFRGITLLELMFVLVIVAILVALAYPSYVEYVRKGKRGDAQHLLLNWAVNQEIFRSNNTTYAAGNSVALPAPTDDNYTFTATNVGVNTYTLTATATGDQVNDEARDGTACNVLTVNQAGAKAPAACWQ